MLAKEKTRRQSELEEYIRELSKKLSDEKEIRAMLLKLLETYKGDFRHSYSSFFPLILDISKNDNECNLDYLSNNLDSICSYVEEDFVSGKKEFEPLREQLNKLCDHLNLEIGRWNYYSQNEQKIEDIALKSVSLNDEMKNTQKELREAQEELKKASKQAASIQTELIAVLSIFAAIVVTFSGGFTFLGSVMSSINEAEYYEAVILTAIVCGMVMFNTIFILMYLVGKITDRNIYARCIEENCSCDGQSLKKCGGIRRIRKRLPYVFYFNLTCVVGIILVCFIWYLHGKGYFL